MSHFISARQLEPGALLEFYDDVHELRDRMGDDIEQRQLAQEFIGYRLVCFFFEDSTRTMESSIAAGQALGMGTRGAFSKDSSINKGETLEDTAIMLASYSNLVVLRHPEDGSVARAAAAVDEMPTSKGLIINGGDGKNQHPTQGTLDGFTVLDKLGQLRDLHHVLGGDLMYSRTNRSYVDIMSLFPGSTFSLVAPKGMEAPDDIKETIVSRGATYYETDDPREVLGTANVANWARPQKERSKSDVPVIRLDEQCLDVMNEECIITHAMPYTLQELAPAVLRDRRLVMYEQAANAIPVRAQLFRDMLGAQALLGASRSAALQVA